MANITENLDDLGQSNSFPSNGGNLASTLRNLDEGEKPKTVSNESPETETFEQEELKLHELNIARAVDTISYERRQLEKNVKKHNPPSKIKYTIIGTLAVISDVVDAFDLTLIGIILTKLVKIFIFVIIFFALRDVSKRTKEMHSYAENVVKKIENFQRKAAHFTKTVSIWSRRAMQASKWAQKSQAPILKKIGHQIPRTMVKIRRTTFKNPIFKQILAAIAEIIPWLAMIPFTTWIVWLSYKEEKRAAEQAQQATQAAIQAKDQEALIVYDQAA